MSLTEPKRIKADEGWLDGVVIGQEKEKFNPGCKEDAIDNRNLIIIDQAGDLILQIPVSGLGDDGPVDPNYYRISSTVLRKKSKYFDRLLDPDKFGEGAKFGYQATELRKKYPDISIVPPQELPLVHIFDAGSFPKQTRNTRALDLFFKILHGLGGNWLNDRISIGDLALLAIVADRFDALKAVKESATQDAWLRNSRNPATKFYGPRYSNEATRRKILFVGSLLGPDEWVRDISWHLIMDGSALWNTTEDIQPDIETKVKEEGVWWNLPHGLEEELAYRRECILNTIISIQDHLIRLYSTSKKRQCTRGYDSSPQCDSFQLGEMVRFFIRKGTLCLQSPITDRDPSATPTGNLKQLMESLKEFPSYQIDTNHSHCGIRHNLNVLLDYLLSIIDQRTNVAVSVCMKCWHADRLRHSWLERKGHMWAYKDRPKISAMYRKFSGKTCLLDHDLYQEMFTAQSRDWTMGLE